MRRDFQHVQTTGVGAIHGVRNTPPRVVVSYHMSIALNPIDSIWEATRAEECIPGRNGMDLRIMILAQERGYHRIDIWIHGSGIARGYWGAS